MANIISQLEKKWTNDKSNLGEILKNTSQTLSSQVSSAEERAARAEAESRIEREWRLSLQEKENAMKEKINNLQGCIKELTVENEALKADNQLKSRQWSEAQTTLEELGVQVSVSKLKVIELQDRERQKQQQQQDLTQSADGAQIDGGAVGIWAPDSLVTHCTDCDKEFNLVRRRHHCRKCGDIFCKTCSDHTLQLPNEKGVLGKPVRVCKNCYFSCYE